MASSAQAKLSLSRGTVGLRVRITKDPIWDPHKLDPRDYVDGGVTFRLRDFNGPFSALKYMQEFLKLGPQQRKVGTGDIITVHREEPEETYLECLILRLPEGNEISHGMDHVLGYHPKHPYFLHTCKFI